MQTYPVHEFFHSWQGEGTHLGKSAFFIRLFGCPVKCSWCDSAGTWHPDYVPKEAPRYSAEWLAEKAADSGAKIAIITGGEPTIHDLGELTEQLRAKGVASHLETCGAFPIKGKLDWITLSPKWDALPLDENLEAASEFKLIVEDANSIEKWIQQLGSVIEGRPIWLQPEWSKRADKEILRIITETVKQRGGFFRAGYQLHKIYLADNLDPNLQKSTPLGGNPELGY